MPFEILENISLYCVISLAYFRLLVFNLQLIRILYSERIRYFCFVTVVLAKINVLLLRVFGSRFRPQAKIEKFKIDRNESET